MNNRDKQIESGSGSGSGSRSGDNRRMYDCDICMRGFTNPQALGGHRNLHRKVRESNLSSSSSSSHSFPFSIPLPPQSLSSSRNFTNPNNNNNPPPYFPTIDSYQNQGIQPPVNPSHNTQYLGSSSGRGGGSYAQGDVRGLNLNLGLGSMNVDDDTNRNPRETGSSQPQDDDLDLDLDLRLGGHHRH